MYQACHRWVHGPERANIPVLLSIFTVRLPWYLWKSASAELRRDVVIVNTSSLGGVGSPRESPG